MENKIPQLSHPATPTSNPHFEEVFFQYETAEKFKDPQQNWLQVNCYHENIFAVGKIKISYGMN